MKDFFPFTRFCDRDKGYSAREFYDAFQAVRPDDMSFYGYDVIIKSAFEVTFIVYGMECNVYGGVGAEKGRFDAIVPTGLTRASIERRALRLAQLKRRVELDESELSIIEGYAADILKSI